MSPVDAPPPVALRDRVFRDDAVIAAGVNDRTLAQLRTIARGFGWPLTGLKRDGIVEQMERRYADGPSTAKAAAELPPELRKLLAVVVWLGVGQHRDLTVAYDRLQAALPPSARLAAPLNAGSAAIAMAVERGLLLGDGLATAPTLRVPWPLAIALAPPPWTPARKVPPAWRREPAGDGAADLLAAGLALLPEGRMRANGPQGDPSIEWHGHWPVLRGESPARSSGGPRALRIPTAASPLPNAARAIVARAIGDPDEGRGAFVAAQLAGLGLLKVESKKGARIDPDAFARWLESPPEEQLAGAVLGWLQLEYPTWDEVSQLVRADGRLQHRRSVDMWRNTILDYRRSRTNLRIDALYGLHRLPRPAGRGDGGWVDGRALAGLVTTAWPAGFLPSPDRDGWFIADGNGRPLALDSDLGRRAAEAQVAAQLRGPLRWLGLVETAVAPRGEDWAVRLSPLGRAFVTGDDSALTAKPDVRWDEASMTASIALRWNMAPAHGALRRYAAYAGPAAAGAPPGTACFRLGPDTLQRAFGEGARPADVVKGLAAAGAPLPASIQRAVEAWWAAWGTVNRFDGLALIEVAGEHLAEVLLATTSLASALVYRVGPTAFIVAEEAVDAWIEQLRQAGHTPRVEEAAVARPVTGGGPPR